MVEGQPCSGHRNLAARWNITVPFPALDFHAAGTGCRIVEVDHAPGVDCPCSGAADWVQVEMGNLETSSEGFEEEGTEENKGQDGNRHRNKEKGKEKERAEDRSGVGNGNRNEGGDGNGGAGGETLQ